MRRRKLAQILLVALVSGTTLVVGSGTALACSCIAPEAATLIADADGTFVGTLVDGPGPDQVFGSSADLVPWVFEVQSAHKGAISQPMTIFSAVSGASCGFEMAEGTQAAIFIYQAGDNWEGNLCSTMAAEALAEFPEVDITPADDPGATNAARWILGVLVVGGAGAVVVTKVRKPKAPDAG